MRPECGAGLREQRTPRFACSSPAWLWPRHRRLQSGQKARGASSDSSGALSPRMPVPEATPQPSRGSLRSPRNTWLRSLRASPHIPRPPASIPVSAALTRLCLCRGWAGAWGSLLRQSSSPATEAPHPHCPWERCREDWPRTGVRGAWGRLVVQRTAEPVRAALEAGALQAAPLSFGLKDPPSDCQALQAAG